MQKSKKLIALVFALMLALCSCAQSSTSGTAGTSASTGGKESVQTSATTQNGAENPGMILPEPPVKGCLKVSDQTVFYGNVMLGGKIERKMMRVATVIVENVLSQTITYVDVIDGDGTILASTMMSGYGFFAIYTPENGATEILRYNIDLAGDKFALAVTAGEFTDISGDGKQKEKLSFVTVTNKNAAATMSDDGSVFGAESIEAFSREAADFIEEGAEKWIIISLSKSSGGADFANTMDKYEEPPLFSEMLPQIRSLNGETLKKIAARHGEMEGKREELAEKSEMLLNAIIAGDPYIAYDMIKDGITESEDTISKVEEWISEIQTIIEGVDSFELENYYREKLDIDGESFYIYNFKMPTEQGIFVVQVMQIVGNEALCYFDIDVSYPFVWEGLMHTQFM